MAFELFILTVVLVIPAVIAFLIAKLVYKRLVKASNKYPKVISAGTFIGSFAVISFSIIFLIIYSFPFER